MTRTITVDAKIWEDTQARLGELEQQNARMARTLRAIAMRETVSASEAARMALGSRLKPIAELSTAEADAQFWGRECPLPPSGWRCSRLPGHEGPCAARLSDTGETEP